VSSRTRPGSVQGEQTGPSTGACVLVDIGEDNGALVVYGSDLLAGEEIEIRSHGGTWAGVHTAVRARHVGGRVLHAGVFGSLPAGRYDLRVRPTSPGGATDHEHHDLSAPTTRSAPAMTTVAVSPGAVTEASLTESPEIL
jgi:hypothetical protein